MSDVETSQPAPDPAANGAVASAPSPMANADASATTGEGSGADSGAPPRAADIGNFARRRHQLSEQAKAVKAQARELAAQKQAMAERDAARDKELADMRAALEALKKGNPLVAAAERGEDVNAHIRDFVEKTSTERSVEELKQQLAERDRRDAEREAAAAKQREEAQRAQEEAGERQAIEGFARNLIAEAEKYPYVATLWNPERIKLAAAEIHVWAKGLKKSVSFEEVAEHLNKLAKREDSEQQERRKRLPPSQDGPGTEPRVQAPPGSGPRANGPAPRTPKEPKRPLTRDEQEAEDLAMLRAASEKDRAAATAKSK